MTTSPPATDLWKLLGQVCVGHSVDLSRYSTEDLIRTASWQGVLPLLSQRLASGLVRGVADDLADQLQKLAYAQAATDLLQIRAARMTLDLLAEHGIEVLLLKGLPLALLHYPQSHLRPRVDIDLYIREGDRQRVADVLGAAGYRLAGLDGRPAISRQFVAAQHMLAEVWIAFDIHWKLSNRTLFRETLPFAECWQDGIPITSLGANARSISDLKLLLHACLHRLGHARGTERDRLIWLYDIHLLLTAMSRERRSEFVAMALARKVGALCADAIEVCNALFNTGCSENLLQLLNSNCRKEPSAALLNASRLRWLWADLAALDGMSMRIAYAKELLIYKLHEPGAGGN